MGKYLANQNGCSVNDEATKSSINFKNAYALCKQMGEGWHLNTRLTYMAAALYSAKHNRQPAVTSSGYTGQMDATHSHNGLSSGIWDMAGCKNEWNAGMRFFHNELQVISGDGVAFDNSAVVIESSETGNCWYCINGLTGELMVPDGNGTTENSLKVDSNGQWNTTSGGCL